MKISREKFNLADATLRIIEKKLPHSIAKEFWLEAYQNGRETGYCIRDAGWACAFSENRNSDHVVVYLGKSFEMAGNVPSEVAYKQAQYFKSPKEAAAEIVRHMKVHREAEKIRPSRNHNDNS